MKKRGIFALILALSLVLAGCTGGMIAPPETLSDGTPGNGAGVNWRERWAWSGPRALIC